MGKSTSWLTDSSLDLEKADAFDVAGVVERLAELIEGGTPPFTISLSGSWGVGKSTIAEELKKRLKNRKIPCVIVDAWTEDIEHLRRTLAIKVGAELSKGSEDDTARKIDDAFRLTESRTLPPKLNLASGSLFRSFRQGIRSSGLLLGIDVVLVVLTVCSAVWFSSLVGLFGALLSASLIFTLFQSGLFLHIVTTSQSRAPAAESVEMARVFQQLVACNGSDSPDKVLVVVDNLDRLDGDDALKALAQIRALVEVPGSRAVFLIPIDRRALARHIQPSIGQGDSIDAGQREGFSGGDGTAADYLEKFFNLDLLLTRPDVLDLRQWALEKAREILRGHDENDLVTAVQVVCSAAMGSPRSLKRILNGVAARQELMDPSASSINLSQLAFIESVVTQFPELAAWMAPDGRRFVSLREEVKHGRAIPSQIDGLTKAAKDRLREFLLANSEIPITASMTRIALSLREDTVWRGVSNPTPLQEALDTGLSDDFASALASVDMGDRENAVLGSVSYIERSVPSFPRDAVSGLVAIGNVVGNYPVAASRLHPLAVQAFIECDDPNRRRVTTPLGRLLFGSGREHSDLDRLAEDFVKTLKEADPKSGVSEGLVWTVRLSGQRLSTQQRSMACEAFKSLQDDVVAPLFESPIDLWATEGPIATKYLDRLTSWEATAPDFAALTTAIDRLKLIMEAGWNNPESLRQVASRASTQLRALANDADGSVLVQKLTELLLSAPSSPEVDEFAKLLMSLPEEADHPARLGVVLRLPVQEETKPAIQNSVAEWLQSAPIESCRSLVVDQRDALLGFGYDPTPVLLKRWIGGAGREWAQLAVDFDDGASPILLSKSLAEAPDNRYPLLLNEAVSICASRDDTQAGDHLLAEMVQRVAQLPAANLVNLAEPLASLQRIGVDISGFVSATKARISSESQLGQLAHSVRQLNEQGIREMRTLAVPLAARGSAAGGIQLEDVEWLVRCTNGSNEARLVAIRVVEVDPISDVCGMVDQIRSGLRGHPEVTMAIVRRAARASSEGEAAMLLNAAKQWKKPAGQELQDYRELLTAIARRWTSDTMTGLINSLQ